MTRLQELFQEIETKYKNDPYYQTGEWIDDKGEVFETPSEYDEWLLNYVDEDDFVYPDDNYYIVSDQPIATKVVKDIKRWNELPAKATGWRMQSIDPPYNTRGQCTFCRPHKGCNRTNFWRKDNFSWKDMPLKKTKTQYK